jgi:hypothetical protein
MEPESNISRPQAKRQQQSSGEPVRRSWTKPEIKLISRISDTASGGGKTTDGPQTSPPS